MLFNSYIFILLFLPVSLIGYFLINKLSFIWGKVWLLGMSLWFYAYFNIAYLPIVVISICFNYGINRLITRERERERERDAKLLLLIFAIAVNIGALFFFKYYDFFFSYVNAAFNTDFVLHHLILPLGISFFTFQQLSYIIDSYRGEVPKYGFPDYALFVTFFPQLIAGPIVTHNEMVPQYADAARKKVNYENLSRGIMAFSFGLAKKVLIADTFGNAVNWGYGNIWLLDSTNALLVMLFYTLQIYFDFSGYCDMATGIGLMFNIDITKNFNSPYRALTITDFWKRWHMTLTRFFTRYVYIPMGGNRKGKVRTYINMFIVFLVSGFWHGANLTFILWGAMHGVFAVITKMTQKWVDKLHPAFNWLITFSFVNVAWIYFRANSIGQANSMIKAILTFNFGPVNPNILNSFNTVEYRVIEQALTKIISIPAGVNPLFLCAFIVILFSLFAVVCMKNTNERIDTFKPTILISCVSVILLVWSILSLSGVSTFLYFNF